MIRALHPLAARTSSSLCKLLPAALAVRASSSSASFASAEEHLKWLASQSALPKGFRVGCAKFGFRPRELPDKPAKMGLTLIALDKPSPTFAAMFTKNAFPGAPVIVGRDRLARSQALQAIVVNNKISNVCAPGGVADSERICAAVASLLHLDSPSFVLPSSTGVIGWNLPVPDMISNLPGAIADLQSTSILPAATGIMTTDMYPKLRSVVVGAGRVVGIAKGAGMVEPNLATMLVYILTDIAVPRDVLRAALPVAVDASFNCMTIDSDTSTSDTVVCVSSNAVPLSSDTTLAAFQDALNAVCAALCEDVVRNGEGVQHVMKVTVSGAPSRAIAVAVGKSVANSPLFKCAVAGNDPNVGRLVAAIGKCVGSLPTLSSPSASSAAGGGGHDVSKTTIRMGGELIFADGSFSLGPETERKLVAHLRAAQLWESQPRVAPGAAPLSSSSSSAGAAYAAGDISYTAPISYPPHERNVEIDIDLGMGGGGRAVVLGSDLTHEYVAENADYRS